MSNVGININIRQPNAGAAYPSLPPPAPGQGPMGLPYPGGPSAGQAMPPLPGIDLLPLTAVIYATELAFDFMVDTVKELDRAFLDMARDAKKYNAVVAQASAFANVRGLFAQINQANRLQDLLADYVTERSVLSEQIKEIETSLAEGILPVANDVLTAINALLKVANEGLGMGEALKGFASGAGKGSLAGFMAMLEKMTEFLGGINKNTKKEKKDLFAEFEDQYEQVINPNSQLNQNFIGPVMPDAMAVGK